jgi:hypothetical protein
MATARQKEAARRNIGKARQAQSARSHGRQTLRRRGFRLQLAGPGQGQQGPQTLASLHLGLVRAQQRDRPRAGVPAA